MSGGSQIEGDAVFAVDDDDNSDTVQSRYMSDANKQAAFEHLDGKNCIFASSFPDSMDDYLTRGDLANSSDAMKDPSTSDLFKGKLKPSHEGPEEQHEAKRRRILLESHRAPAEKSHAMQSTVGQPADSEEKNHHQSLALPNVGHNNVGGTPLELLGHANKDQQLPTVGPASTQSSLHSIGLENCTVLPSGILRRVNKDREDQQAPSVRPMPTQSFASNRSQRSFDAPAAMRHRIVSLSPRELPPHKNGLGGQGTRRVVSNPAVAQQASRSQEYQQQPQSTQQAQQLPQERQQHLQSPYCFPVQFQVEVSRTHRDKIISIAKEEEAGKLTLTTIKTLYKASPWEKATQGPLFWADMEPASS
ncbi:uncharacterized protein E0L32_011959 [Thyridium curvatum]|uniref:Uncharacterized protein n=1 Tax=Thyridium curvatum TaxID=1093900 RepID=A0A507BMG6_9PEZI|nr:uncharacterized protein E0L32_011959 [Thyridium curvatum]TPX17958.1 hypothetical protein E0L32_011959 [Thyridium curvatum]